MPLLRNSWSKLFSLALATSATAIPTPNHDQSTADTAVNVKRDIWKPCAGTTWQIELDHTLSNYSVNAMVYDIDLFDNTATIISNLHSLGRKVICYFSAGTYESWRPDASQFLSVNIGNEVDGWAGENWTNTRSTNVRNIMLARLDLAVTKGCDGVDPDNVDAYDNGGGGFSLTTSDAINYVEFLANASHSRGLALGLKNAGDILPDVIDQMQWGINEQCEEFDECSTFQPFIDAHKPVFHIEYADATPGNIATICDDSTAAGFSTIIKDEDQELGDDVYECPVELSC